MHKKRIGKLFFTNVLGVAILLIFTSLPASAEESTFKIKDGEVVNTETNETYSNAVKVENGEENKLSLEELKDHLEKREKDKSNMDWQMNNLNNYDKINHNNIQPQGLINIYEEYNSSSNYYPGNERKISSAINCSGSGAPCDIKSETGWTISESFNVDTGFPQIRSGASFGWTKSVERSISYTLSVPVGETKAMYFDPAYKVSNGVLTVYSDAPGAPELGKHSVKALSPQTTAGGEPDGVYFLR